MFDHVDDALEALLRADEPFLADASISFADPQVVAADGDAGAEPDQLSLTLSLSQVSPSAKGASSGTEIVERDGVKVRRQRLPTIELTYAVTARAPDARDQHRALAAALRTFLRHPTVPDALLPAPLADSGASVSLRVPKRDLDESPAPEVQRASLDLRVTVPMDLEREHVLADAPGSTDFGFEDQRSGATSTRRRYAGEIADPAAVGADVLGPAGAATVEADGRFVIVARPGDQIVVMIDPPVTATVPESGRIVIS